MPDNTAAGTVGRKSYSSNMTDERWAIIEPFLKPGSGPGRRNRHSLPEVVDAAHSSNADGCKRADLPHDSPPPAAVPHHSCKWVESGLRQRIDDALREAARIETGRDPRPSAGAVDSQTVKAAPTGARGTTTGPGARPATSGTHILVDPPGWLVAAAVACRPASDAAGATNVFDEIDRPNRPRLRVAFADSACHRDELYDRVASEWHRSRVVNRPADAVGFVVLPMRREAERTSGWIVQSAGTRRTTNGRSVRARPRSPQLRQGYYCAGSRINSDITIQARAKRLKTSGKKLSDCPITSGMRIMDHEDAILS